MKQQGIYWLCEHPGEIHRRKAELLTEIDYELRFFSDLESLESSLATKRVPIILLSSEGVESEVIHAIHALASNPAIQGARLILCGFGASNQLLRYAAGQGFRDILQLDWEDHTWLERFEFSASGQQDQIEPLVIDHNFQESISFHLPVRVVWLSHDKMWIESRLRPDIGSELSLQGDLANMMTDEGSLRLSVENQAKSNLVFRFSEAMVADWRTGSRLEEDRIEHALASLARMNRGVRPKVFLAVQSPALRNTILKYLSPLKYEVHTALQKRSVVTEPKFFSPHLVFIEDRICTGEAMGRFQEMVTNLPEKSTVVIVGGREDVTSFRNFSAGRRLESLSRIPKNLTEIIEKQYLPSTHFERDHQAIYLPADHPLSFGEVELKAQIVAWVGQELEITLPMPIENFGLARISSKSLAKRVKGDVYVKVSSIKPSPDQSQFIIVCRLCTAI